MTRGGPSSSACLFPIRSHGRGDRDKCALNAKQIDPLTVREVTEYCERNAVKTDDFLIAVWAVILQQFTENTTIHMGLQQVDSSSWSELGMKSRMRTVSRSFDQATSLSALLQADLWTTTAVEAASFNTGLVICSPCSIPMSKGIEGMGMITSQLDSVSQFIPRTVQMLTTLDSDVRCASCVANGLGQGATDTMAFAQDQHRLRCFRAVS
jgi:hypothetical protein